jgi:hypothetical protein
MGDIKNLNSTAIYAWTTLISVLICVPGALIAEGPRLRLAMQAAHATHSSFYRDLFVVGLLYHLCASPVSRPLPSLRTSCSVAVHPSCS